MSKTIRDRVVAAFLFVWLVGGAFLYHLRFSKQFYAEHESAIRALLGLD